MRLRTTCWIGVCTIALAVYAGPPASGGSSETRSKDRSCYTFLYLGGFETSETAAVLDHSTGAGAFGGGWGCRFHRFLTFELDANISDTDYDLPEGIVVPNLHHDTLSLSTVGVLGNLKFGYRLGRLRPHVGVGLGLGIVDVALSHTESWYPESLESELSLLTQILVGLDIRVSRRSYLGIEYRQLFAHRTIDFGGETIDGGGESFVLVYRLAGWGSSKRTRR